MALLTSLSLDDARRIGSDAGVDVVSIEALEAGSVNSNFRVADATGARYFLRVYEEQSFDGARAEEELLAGLAACGVPVVVPVARAGGPGEHRGKPVAIFPWVDGEILCQQRVTPERCRRVGEALARVHAASAKVACRSEGRFRVEDVRERIDAIERAGAEEHVRAARRIREGLRVHAARRDRALPRGVIHGDLFRDNVLWRGGAIAALIDFESASLGTFAFDVMVAVEAWCYADRFEPDLVEALLGGYGSVRPLEPGEVRGLATEGALAALRFATTRITDYSMRAAPGEPPERDYRRFLSRLEELEAGALDAAVARIGGHG